jgi:hypothetical protein
MAAVRCLDWRRVATIPPPDEVAPGEEDRSCGYLTVADEAALEAAE